MGSVLPRPLTLSTDYYLDLKGVTRGANTVRYVVPWDAVAKGPSPAVAGTLQALSVGDKVMVAWSANPERLWVKQVKLVSRAPAGKPAGRSSSKPSRASEP